MKIDRTIGEEIPLDEVLIVDDDEVSRELLTMFVESEGYLARAVESGDEALALLKTEHAHPRAVVSDMRMPGITGPALATALRELCGSSTRVIAMSGSNVRDGELEGFDGFLLKPFGVEELRAILTTETPDMQKTEPADPIPEICVGTGNDYSLETCSVLSEATFSSLARSMPREQLLALYSMCLDDADRRIQSMRIPCIAGDVESFQRSAHAIKGGCGMVGALELASMASAMEEDGPPPDGNVGALERFLTASARLRHILNAQQA
jgi:CheY-like chemotaxis protein